MSFFFNITAPTEISTLSLHGALPICLRRRCRAVGDHLVRRLRHRLVGGRGRTRVCVGHRHSNSRERSEEHTSELPSRQYLVCRLLLAKKITILLDTPHHFNSPRPTSP